jgi:hypothetical protein
MAQVLKLKRTAVQGKSPTTDTLELGELAINTYDGKLYFEKDNGVPSIQSIVVTDALISGSINIGGAITASNFIGNGSQITFGGTGMVSGSSQLTSSLDSRYLNTLGEGTISGSFTGSFGGDGSGLINLPASDISQVATVNYAFFNSSNISVSHNFNSRNVIISVYDSNYAQIIPSSVTLTDLNTSTIVLTSAQSGYVVVAKGGHIVSGSADDSNKLNGQSGSYYLDYSNHTNKPSGLVSGSFQIKNYGDFVTTGSNSFTGIQNINGNINITGSIIPGVTNTYDLGSDTNQFRHLYISSGSIYMDGTKVFGSETILPSIGAQLEGGTVFYIAPDKSYVLIVDNDNLTDAISGGTRVDAASGSVIGTGESNTNIIIATTGLTQNPARKAYDSVRGGYSDWYLPSVEELYYVALYSGTLGQGFYWSSTAGTLNGGPGYNYQLVRGDGLIITNGDNASWPVRAIRKSTTRTTTLQTLTNQNISGSISVTGAVTATSFVGNKILSSDGNAIQFGNSVAITGSLTTTTGLIVGGDLVVNGTTTTIDSTNVNIGDNIIVLNGTLTTNGGIYVKDAAGGNTTTGSILWDTTNDKWIAGPKGSELGILRTGGDSIVSGSSQITFSGITSLPTLISGSIQILGGSNIVSSSTQIISSLVSQSINLGNGAITASYFVGDGSGITNVVTEIAEVATITSSFDNQSTIAVTHNFNTKNVLVSVYGTNDSQIIPSSVTLTNNNTATIVLSSAQSGYAVVAKGGHIVSGSTSWNNLAGMPSGLVSGSSQITGLTTYKETVSGNSTYSITHSLGEEYPIVQAWNTANKRQEVPSIIESTSVNALTITFAGVFAGLIIIKK